MIRRFFLGAEAEGLFTLFAIAFFMMGVILFGIGLFGEYVGRIYQQVQGRPRFVVQTILEQELKTLLRANMTNPSAIVFAYHSVGVRGIKTLLAKGVDIKLVVSHEDNPNEAIWFESVAALCAEHGIPRVTPENPGIRLEFIAQLRELNADFFSLVFTIEICYPKRF